MKTVLVVDDLETFRDSIKRVLEKFGFRVLIAGDGEQALNVLQSERPDLILLDLSMPVMDGISLLTEIRARPMWSYIPVILLTGLADKDNIVLATKLGISGYLVKSSFSASYLLAKIEEVLKIDLDFMNSKSKDLLHRSDQTLTDGLKAEKNL